MTWLCVVYDSGSLFAPEILDVKEEDLITKFIGVSCCSDLVALMLPSHVIGCG